MPDQQDTAYYLAQLGTNPAQLKANTVGANAMSMQQKAQMLHQAAQQSSASSMSRAKSYLNHNYSDKMDSPTPGIQSE